MKKILLILSYIAGLVILILLALRIAWGFKSKNELNTFILSKSVTQMSQPEHKAFVWLLNHNRLTPPNRKSYSYKKDYYGFIPLDRRSETFDLRSVRINEVDAYASVYDVAYYADCYGVYSFEWYKGKSKPIRSQKVYGGLNQNDYLLMMKMLDKNKLVIAEYNMFSSPTNALVRNKTEELLGVSWSGWSGRYYTTLDADSEQGPPEWMRNLYESQHIGVWPTENEGIVLLNNDGIIEVLTVGDDLYSGIPLIRTQPEAANRFGVSKEIPFIGWFELIDAKNNKTPSYFHLDATESGVDKLNKHRLTAVFPAVIESSSNQQFFYLCGDFAHNPVQMWTSKLAFGKQINNFLYKYRSPNRARFFYEFYTPLIESFMSEHLESTEEG